MMLYDMFATIVFWFIGGAVENNQITDATTSPEQVSDLSPLHHARSVTDKPHETNEKNGVLNNQSETCVQPAKDSSTKDSRSKETSKKEMDNKEENKRLNTNENNGTKESKCANIDNSNNHKGDINTLSPAPEGSYAAYLAECDELARIDNIYMYPSDDEESILSDDSTLESPPSPPSYPSPPSNQPQSQIESTQQQTRPEFPSLKDIEPTTDLELALKAGPMPRLCTFCFRWEDQPDDKYDEKDMVSDKWFRIGNIVFFRKIKPFWTQCSACGFGVPKKVVRGRRTNKLRKLFCKMSGREYRGYEFKRYGYEWMSEEGRNKGLSAYM